MTKNQNNNNNKTNSHSQVNLDQVNQSSVFAEFDQRVDDATEDIQKANAELEEKYGMYLKKDYTPEGYNEKGLKDKIDEAIDQKEMEDIEKEVDDKLAEIMSDVIDEAERE